tara:strand:+ start:8851 stop:9054 length:204 start_codon:yes stop_codon:yes gene_type:complete
MPTYEYRCRKCGKQFEVFQAITDEPLKKKAGCKSKRKEDGTRYCSLERLLFASPSKFKGEGWTPKHY